MRNLLALLAAFTLSTSTAITAVACGTADQTTVVIFDWNGVINGEHNRTADDMYQFLLDNTENGIGQSLYKDIVDYISLSILKTNSNFADDYQFAKKSVENEIKNIQDSLRAKYGRKWETQWKNFLKEPAQGGDGKTGNYQRYFDVLLKNKANTIVNQYYVGDNYHNFQYYNSSEITIWLNDIYDKIKNHGFSMQDYIDHGPYKDKLWIVAKSYNNNADPLQGLSNAIENAKSVSDIALTFKVAKTKDDTNRENGEDYLVDPSSAIKGLLSNQQAKIAQVWMKNQGPIWTRQIVVPFRDGEAKNNALKEAIKLENFNTNKLTTTINNIRERGFERALREEMQEIGSVTSSSASGDLGLVTLNSDAANIKPSFSYYLYRYVTSAQGIGNHTDTTIPYNLPEYDANTDAQTLINAIDRTTTTPSNTHTSRYNDIVWMKDGSDEEGTKWYSGANGNQVAVFIDADGIHFIQTPGITYNSTPTTTPLSKLIIDYNQLLSDPIARTKATWEDVAPLVDRPGGLTNNPYLDYLQTQYLLWNTKNFKTYFDLNDSLSKFTSGSSDITSEIWWDYILYFNKNTDNIHWNLPELFNTNIYASEERIYGFIRSMKRWFSTTFEIRWNRLQGLVSTDNLIKNIRDLNNTWDEPDYQYGPKARLDPNNIKIYLDKVAGQTIWLYDPNSIQD